MRVVRYSGGYKYQIKGDWHIQTQIRGFDIHTAFIRLTREGLMTVRNGYACDGPSGPTIDTPLFKLGAFTHDPLYQLIREGHLPFEYWRRCDYELKSAVLRKLEEKRDHSTRWRKLRSQAHERAWDVRLVWIMAGLNAAAGTAAKPKNKKTIHEI